MAEQACRAFLLYYHGKTIIATQGSNEWLRSFTFAKESKPEVRWLLCISRGKSWFVGLLRNVSANFTWIHLVYRQILSRL